MNYLILAILGLCAGSFVNALVWRLHEQEAHPGDKSLSIISGRSKCPNCGHVLAWHELIPLASWIYQSGRCRHCHKPISWQYPIVEILSSVLFVVSYLYWPHALDPQGIFLLAVWLVCLTGLIGLAVYDVKWMLLPDRIVYPLLVIAGFSVAVDALVFSGVDAVIEAVLGLVFLGGLFYVLFQISDGRWIGGGDVKLGFLLGIIVGGPIMAILVLFVASLLGTLVSLILMLSHRLNIKHRIPFGPFLISAAIIVLLFGQSTADWYQNLVLPSGL